MKTILKKSSLVAVLLIFSFVGGMFSAADVVAALNRLRTQDERVIVNVVKRAKNAVVSVIGSKEVGVFETYQDQIPLGANSQFFFTIDRLRQVGTQEKDVLGGTGFFITKDGYIITNNHVVSDTSLTYRVLTNDGKLLKVKVIFKKAQLDIALLKVEGEGYPVIRLSSSDRAQLGQTVVAIGNSLAEFKNTVSKGIVSGLDRTVNGDNGQVYENLIQTDASINQGNSGGPLLNSSGELIGVNFSVVLGAENIGFAIPSYIVKQLLYKANPKLLRANKRSSR